MIGIEITNRQDAQVTQQADENCKELTWRSWRLAVRQSAIGNLK